MVEIYLNIHGSQIPFLFIPNSDVQRLSKRPFKWLRYVMFSICGARGDISATPDGPPVDYGDSLADIIYYFNPSGNCTFVDYEGLNEQLTTTSLTDRRYDFRQDIIRRDGSFCVITQDPASCCDAAHLIPRCKGDEYIRKVVRDRSHLYHPSPSILGIDDAQNGVLLNKTMHAMLSDGSIAFLKTPNYGLEPDDIHRVNRGPECMDHITLQRLKKPDRDDPNVVAALTVIGLHPLAAFAHGAHVDALFQGTGDSLPPAIILDYAYGVAAYDRWSRKGDDEGYGMMRSYCREHYATPRLPSSGGDDAHGGDYTQRRHYMSIRRGDAMAKAMDDLNLVLMNLQGITPQEAASRRKKQIEEEELRNREASRTKVMEWRDALYP